MSMYSRRIETLRRTLTGQKFDAILIANPENRRYLSGYSPTDHSIDESSGFLLIPRVGSPFLLTDSRYSEQAENETKAAGYTVEIYTRGAVELLRRLLPSLQIRTLAFEANYTLHTDALEYEELGTDIGVTMIPAGKVVEEMRCIKDEEEIAIIRRSVALNEQVFQQVYANLSHYETEIDLALAISMTMRRLGAERESFPTIVASGARSSLPHAEPGHNPILQDAPLLIDMGLILDGYCSDMTRTVLPGTPTDLYLERHRIVRRAQLAGVAAIREGVTGREVDAAARKIITDAGYGNCFGHGLGHGVGLAVHELPRLSALADNTLKNGMIVTVEPGIYLPGWGGIRLENMVVVREDGCELLNSDMTALDL